MADFLMRLAQRALGTEPAIQPLIAPQFAPVPAAMEEPAPEPLREPGITTAGGVADQAPRPAPTTPTPVASIPSLVTREVLVPAQARMPEGGGAPDPLAAPAVERVVETEHTVSQAESLPLAPPPEIVVAPEVVSPSLQAIEPSVASSSGAELGAEPISSPRPAPPAPSPASAQPPPPEPQLLPPRRADPVPSSLVEVSLSQERTPSEQPDTTMSMSQPTPTGIPPAPTRTIRPEVIIRQEQALPVRAEQETLHSRTALPAPTIRVTIGRVEVQAIQPPLQPPPPAPPPRREPALSLDDYLKQRDEEGK